MIMQCLDKNQCVNKCIMLFCHYIIMRPNITPIILWINKFLKTLKTDN